MEEEEEESKMDPLRPLFLSVRCVCVCVSLSLIFSPVVSFLFSVSQEEEGGREEEEEEEEEEQPLSLWGG